MSKEVKRFYIMPGSAPVLLSGDPAYTPMTNHLTDVHTVPLVLASDYDALLAERDRLRDVLNALRAATPSLTCESFHHARRDQHDHDEECPPFERWIAAALACNAALQGAQP